MCNQSHGKVLIICTLFMTHYIGLMFHLNLTKTSQLQEQLVRHSTKALWLNRLNNTPIITHSVDLADRRRRTHTDTPISANTVCNFKAQQNNGRQLCF